MRGASIILLLAVLLAGVSFAAAAKAPFNIPLKNLYSAPDENSNRVFSFPIEVKLLDVSEDGNWYKVKIAYAFGPFGYTYVGWTRIPVGEILAERAERAAKIAFQNLSKQ